MSLSVLSRLLTLLLGIFYLGGVCELDAKECKQNYGKESHEYVLSVKSTDLHAPAPQPDGPVTILLPVPVWQTVRAIERAAEWAACQTPPVPEGPPPRPRRYLRLAVLRV